MLREANALVIFSCCRLILWFPDNSYCINRHMILFRECMIIQHYRVFMNWIVLFHFQDAYVLNPFVPSASFLHSLKTSENLTIFWCFQGVRERVRWELRASVCLQRKSYQGRPTHNAYQKDHSKYSENADVVSSLSPTSRAD